MRKRHSVPTLAEMLSLNGRIFETLTAEEITVLNFMRDRGRKFRVSVAVIKEIDPANIAADCSQAETQAMITRASSRVKVVQIADSSKPPMFGPSHFFDSDDYEPRAGKSFLMNKLMKK